jgi:CMP-N,N'-diacetyllegionaminic acid synthase
LRSARVLGVIPARGGSKRIPRKNLRLLNGKPLIAYTIEAASKAQSLTNWVVSTDDEEIRDVSLSLGAYVIRRPEELATDLASSDAVALHALEWMGSNNYDILVLLHPTSPIRSWKHIDEAVFTLWASTAPSLASVEYAKRSYRHNASIYVVKVPFDTLYNDKTIPYLMDQRHSLDIDTEDDWEVAELWARMKSTSRQLGALSSLKDGSQAQNSYSPLRHM